jgi:molecular chaperone DnaK (HSP70)
MLVAAALMVTACGGSAKRSHDLQNDVRLYNEGVRWVNLPQAAVRILPSEREDFLDEREELEEELRIDDFEIMRLKTEGESQETATVQIKWTWHMDREGIVRTTTSRQAWRRYGSRWIMMKEARLRGDEMPGITHEVEDEKKDTPGEESEEAVPTEEEAAEAGVGQQPQKEHVQRHLRSVLRVAEESHGTTE